MKAATPHAFVETMTKGIAMSLRPMVRCMRDMKIAILSTPYPSLLVPSRAGGNDDASDNDSDEIDVEIMGRGKRSLMTFSDLTAKQRIWRVPWTPTLIVDLKL